MPLEVPCRACGRSYVPSTGDILSGAYRRCEACRTPPATGTRPTESPAAA